MKKKFYLSIFVFLIVILLSCEKENEYERDFRQGVFIVNEGAFRANNGSISWYNPDNKTIINNIFEEVNERPLGDVVQSFGIAGNLGFVVVNNSQKVEIVDLKTFKSKGVISNFTYPRYFTANQVYGFVSNGSMEGSVFIIDLVSLDVIKEIPVGYGPEQMVIAGNKLYVANSGGWGFDNTISVIDIGTKQVISTIEVGDVPFALQKDTQNNLWVLCRGKVVYDFNTWEITEETNSRLLKINTNTNAILSDITIGNKGDFFWPTFLTMSGDKSTLYLNELNGVYSVNVASAVVSANPLISGSFSGLGIHPVTNEFFALKTPDFTSAGTLEIYNNNAHKTGEFNVGIGPNMVVFGN